MMIGPKMPKTVDWCLVGRTDLRQWTELATCKLVQKQQAILPDTLGDLTSASKYF